MSLRHASLRAAAAAASLALPLALLAGCSGALTSTATSSTAISVSGNWQLASTAPAAAQLPKLSGTLTGTSAALKGIFHSDSTTSCIAPSKSIAVTGAADAKNHVTLAGTGLDGGTLTIAGDLASDGKSLTNATYNVTGGTCAFAKPADGTAVQYADITGTYKGNFFDQDSSTTPVLTVTAQLTQSPSGDTNGDFTISGSGTVPQNPCFNTPVPVVSSQVTGGSFSITYADRTTGDSVTAAGNFSPDGTTLTVTQWTLSGPCGPDTGYGSMTRQ